MVDVAEDVKEPGEADVTPAELKRAKGRTHSLDITKEINRFLDIFKYTLKTKKRPKGMFPERVNWYKFSEVSDGWMVKYEIEGFAHGKSMGCRPMKFYISGTKKKEIEKFVDDFPRRGYQDTRSHTNRERPEKKIAATHPDDMLLNLDDIWDVDKLKKASKKAEEDKNKDIWAS